MKKIVILSTVCLSFFAVINAEPIPDSNNPNNKKPMQTECKQEPGHVYTSFRTGINFLHAGEEDEIELSPKVGYALGAAVGYRWRYNLELEAEFFYRYNGVTTVEFLEHEAIACGNVKSLSYMVNLIYVIPYSFSLCSITPFFGAGIGYNQQHANACPYVLPGKGENGGFGWQVIGGLKQKLYKSFEISADYRFSKGPLNYLYNQTLNFSFTYLF